jgi:glyoxylase-like metal-dependent hydrolase (beta-lactamase superfamily II)
MPSFRIHALGGVGHDSNVYLIEDEYVALIDAGTGRLSKLLIDEIRNCGIDPKNIEFLINTHCHFDHAGGDRSLVDVASCRVFIHETEKPVLEEGNDAISCALLFGEHLPPVKVERGLREGEVLELGALALRVLHTPGHTVGSICLYDPEHLILFSGDTVFADGVGRTDLPTGSESLLLESLKRLSRLPVKRLYPGHGAPNERDPQRSIRDALRLLTL